MKIDKAAVISFITLLAGIGGLVSSSVFQKPLDDLIGSTYGDKIVDAISLISLLAAYVAAHYSTMLTGGNAAPLAPAAASNTPQNGAPQ